MSWHANGKRPGTWKAGKLASLLQQRPAAFAVASKVGQQFPASPEGQLMRAIFRTSVDDLFNDHHRASACRHLQGRIFEAEICGIDADWIRKQFRDAGISLDESPAAPCQQPGSPLFPLPAGASPASDMTRGGASSVLTTSEPESSSA